MRILHVSDTHVGYANYARFTPDGLNQREQDFFDAFARAIDLAIELRVAAVVHTGDVFDSVRPSNRAIHHVLAQCGRLSAAGIPMVVISGNHEAPRLRETGAVLKLLEFIPGVHSVYKGVYQKIRIGDLAVHAVPHASDNDAHKEQLRLVAHDESARYNVALFHAGIVGVDEFRMGEFHEQMVAQNEIPRGMDYVGLGHYHRAVEVAPKVWYAGSTERASFREAKESKSVNLVDLARGTIDPIVLPSRRMIDLPWLECAGMQDAQIVPALMGRLADVPEGAIVRLRVTALPAHVYGALDFRRIKEQTAGALHFELVPEILRGEQQAIASESIADLAIEFDGFLSQRAINSDREELLLAATALLRDAQQEEAL